MGGLGGRGREEPEVEEDALRCLTGLVLPLEAPALGARCRTSEADRLGGECCSGIGGAALLDGVLQRCDLVWDADVPPRLALRGRCRGAEDGLEVQPGSGLVASHAA
mmetsp:Transcript_21550/g.50239  ORF Transcript_21550/g.50239 Transcript_21550/m.50239 type:complete len:107 (+) Transcript_21550:618-938(+)